MAVNPMEGGIAWVSPGWTGAVSVTIGSAVATVAPPVRTSAIRVALDLAARCRAVHGGQWEVWTVLGQLVLSGPATIFTLTATGTTATRLGFTGTYTGAASYTGEDTDWIAWDDTSPQFFWDAPGLSMSQGRPVADGSSGGTPVQEARSVTVRATVGSDLEGAMTLAATTATTFDAWLGGRYLGRVRLTRGSVTRWGARGDQAYAELDGLEVRL